MTLCFLRMLNQTPDSIVTMDALMRRIASVCDRHGTPSGMPADLKVLLLALRENKALAMEFWGVMGLVADEPAGRSNNDISSEIRSDGSRTRPLYQARILEAIVRVLTGRGVADMVAAGGDSRQAVVDMASLLAGEDIHRSNELPYDAEAGQVHAVESRDVSPSSSYLSDQSAADVHDTRGMQDEGQLAAAATADWLMAEGPALTEEKSAQSARPPWYDILSAGWLDEEARAAERADSVEPVLSEPSSARIGDHELRRVLFESVGGASEAASNPGAVEPVQLRMPIPVNRSVARNSRRGVLVLGALMVLAVTCGAIYYAHKNRLLQRSSASVLGLMGKIGKFVDAELHDESAEAGGAGSAGSATPGPRKTQKKPNSRVNHAAAVQSAATNTVPVTPDVEGNKPAGAADAVSTHNSEKEVSAAEPKGPTPVPAAVMKENLITSPISESPAVGRDGRVVLQVLISKEGAVEKVHVIEGDKVLWPVAAKTVLAWRYRPYLVNDRPVQVVTTVTVFLKMDQ